MSGIAIPITLQVLPGILQFVETIFSHQSNSGKSKFGAAVNLTQSALTAAAAAGAIPAEMANNISGIAGLVQQTVDSMKATGQLGGNAPHTNVAKDPVPPQGPVVQAAISETHEKAAASAAKAIALSGTSAEPMKQSWEK